MNVKIDVENEKGFALGDVVSIEKYGTYTVMKEWHQELYALRSLDGYSTFSGTYNSLEKLYSDTLKGDYKIIIYSSKSYEFLLKRKEE